MTTKKMLIGTALALALAGCGSKPDAQTNTDTAAASDTAPAKPTVAFDPCGVLTADEVTAIIADTITQTNANDHSCAYHAGPNDDDGTQLMIYPTGGKAQLEDIRSANKMLGNIGSAVSAQGDVGKDVQASITPPAEGGAPAIGDEAIWEPNDVLAVRKGDLFVEATPPIVLFGGRTIPKMLSDADKRVISQKLVTAVLAKLGH